MPIAAAIIGAAVIGGGAELIGASKAADAAGSAADENNALERQIYGQNSANERPYIEAGDAANTALEGFLGLGGDPAAAQKAFESYLNSTGYRFNLDQGLEAAQQSQVAKGMGDSGATLKALDRYGTGLANTYGQQYFDNLGAVANRGAGSANALASQGQAYVNGVSSNNTSAAGAAGSADMAGAKAFSGILGTALNAFNTVRGQSSYGGGSNAFAPGG